MTLNDDIGI